MNTKYIPLFALLLLVTISSLAQTDTTGITAENVEVVKRYEAAILQARKKKIPITKPSSNKSPIQYNYNVTTEKVIDFDRPDPEIRPLGYTPEDVSDKDVKNGYIYGAYGTHSTINAGAAYHYYIEDWLDAGFKADFLSTRDSLNLGTRNFSDLDLDSYIGYHLGKQTKVRLHGNWNRTRREDAFLLTENNEFGEIPYDTYGVGAELSHNVFEDSGLALRIGSAHQWHQLDNNIEETDLSFDLNVIKSFSDNLSFELPIQYQINNGSSSLEIDARETKLLVANPNIRYKSTNYLAKVGLQYLRDDSTTRVFPIIDLSMIAIAAGIDVRLYTEAKYTRNNANSCLLYTSPSPRDRG